MSTSTITLDGNPVTLVPLPTSAVPSMVEPWVNDSVASITFPFTGQTQSQGSTGADLWGMMVTYPPLTELQAAPFRAWLKQMRGISRGFQWTPADYVGPAGSPSGVPLAGTANANLVPDSSLLNGWVDWTNPGGGWAIVTGPTGGGGTNAFSIPSGSDGASVSQAIPVIPGATYTLSCYIQAPAYTNGVVGPVEGPPAVEVQYTGGFIPIVPTSNTSAEYNRTFTIPAGVTSVTIWVSAQASTWTSGTLLMSSFQLQLGSTATAYVASLPSVSQSAAATKIYTSGWTASTFGLLLPDDLIQIGYRLHTVCDIVSSDANGNASFEIWPSLREDLAAGTPIITGNPQGLFRLSDNKRSWSKDYNQLTHLSFPITEYR